MKKTLAVILNYNTPELTDRLYEQLKPYERIDYELVVLDNGSPQTGRSKYTTYVCEQNVYFGGGLNHTMQLVIDNPEYDSLLIINSDIILHGYKFVETLRRLLFSQNYKILSPAVLEPNQQQCYWPTMHCWNSDTVRNVPWVDFQCPLIHRDVIEEIKQFDNDLIFGWGNDVYTGLICEEKNWKIGVVDYCPVLHLSQETIGRNKQDKVINNYSVYANQGMLNFFNKIGKYQELVKMRNLARNYVYEQ